MQKKIKVQMEEAAKEINIERLKERIAERRARHEEYKRKQGPVSQAIMTVIEKLFEWREKKREKEFQKWKEDFEKESKEFDREYGEIKKEIKELEGGTQ